ncbi:MAG: hypothetical protein K0Q84_1125 [Arthrobacter sp.]|nr:hypothetical protein [Arthrobacter sp.]
MPACRVREPDGDEEDANRLGTHVLQVGMSRGYAKGPGPRTGAKRGDGGI